MPGRLDFASHAPSLQFRFKLVSNRLPNAQIYCKAATQPSVNNNPVRADFLNYYIKYKGKTEWNDITLTCYTYEGITAQEVYDYFNDKHQTIEFAIDYRNFIYKHNLDLFILNPLGEDAAKWTMKGAFISQCDWGSVDWGSDAPIELKLTIVYDYAKYETLGGSL